MRLYQHAFLAYVLMVAAIPGGCSHSSSRNVTLKDFPASPGNPKVLADYQPWFGDPDHIDVGYNSQDPNVLRKQIESARNMGVYAFVVDWYGPRRPFLDRSTALLQRIASEQHFHIALMYDETQDDNGHATDDAMEAMELAYQKVHRAHCPGARRLPHVPRATCHFCVSQTGPHGLEPGTAAGEPVGIAADPAV